MSERILIIESDDALSESLELALTAEGYQVARTDNAETALELLETTPVDAVLSDTQMLGVDGLALLPQITRRTPEVPVILMAACDPEALALETLQRGADDCVVKPCQRGELLLALRKALDRERLRRATQLLQRDIQRGVGDRPIVAASASMIELLELLERAAGFKTTALLAGERGTGKEVLARAIHAQSARHREAFVAVRCAAVAENLLESELFGHAKAAFAGADRARRGLFVDANGGTLFLDEVGELSPALQVKLLRVLQDEEVRPAGEAKPQKVDVRVLASTTRDLEEAVQSGGFREDLFYRLSVVRIEVPPLRERREDIPLLADHFLAHFRDGLGRPVRGIADDALERITGHHWPGNVRELANVIERAVMLCESDMLRVQDLPATVVATSTPAGPADASNFSLKRARRESEAQTIRRALRATIGNRTHAAKLLEISHRALLYKLKEYAIRD